MAPQTLPPIPERVARGATLLDTHLPGWAAQVSLDDLDAADPGWCILRQFYPSPILGFHALREAIGGLDVAWFGFDISQNCRQDPDERAAYAALTAAWRAQILSRRATSQSAPSGEGVG